MTDYKLVPKSIVDELAQFIRRVNGDNKMGAGFLADMICERFSVDAPAVQGEPLGYVVPRMAARLGKGELCGISVLDQPEDGHTLPVYLAPQPAEQQPCPVCKGCGLNPLTDAPVACANCHGGTPAEQQPAPDVPVAEVSQETFSSDGTSDIITKNLPIGMKLYAAPQPTPDVAELVEALKGALENLEKYAVIVDGEWGSCRDLEGLEADGELPECIKDVRAALSVYRKGGK